MELKYLGTAAYEGFPGLFCECEACKMAESKGGKNIRTRTSMLINKDTLIDFSPDAYLHKLKYNLNLAKVRHFVITHSHSDHFNPLDLMARCEGNYAHFDAENKGSVVGVYGNDKVKACLDQAIQIEFGGNQSFIGYTQVVPFTTYEVGTLKVTPLLAQHQTDEQSLIYLIEEDGKTLLYGNDTGIFPEETFEYLKTVKLDVVSLDCTHGAKHRGGYGHLGLESCVEVKERLLEIGSATENTTFILTHFSHNGGLCHEDLEKQAKPYQFVVSYDGMELAL
ncbi:MAG: MBL fold metallo-hydrolase [Niameybacter sp.]|uniref:MBL fold metallo-hydrolase n=1 Tax=Niameybacter sp. TaxID=2033640 RepID=UPI002FC5C77A